MALMQVIEEKWEQWKRPLLALVVGLIAGPFVSGFFGWQVTTETMEENIEEAVVQQQAEMCAYMAHQVVQNTADMDYRERRDIADKYADMPWDDSATYSVEAECAGILAEQPSESDAKTG